MRSFKFVSVFMLVAMVLAACGGAPATTAPAAQPAATTAPAAQPAATTAPAAAPAATTAPAAAAPSGGQLKVAILAPLSGSVPTFGVSTRDGALLAIDEWNAKGGVLGMKLVPIVEDSQCTPDPAVNAANKVINQDKVHYIIGEVCSKASIPISEIATAAKVIQISPTSTNESVTVGSDGKVKPYIFRACFIDSFQGLVGAKFALGTLKAKTAFVMSDQSNDYVKGLAENFEKAFTENGGQIVGKENYTSKDTDFSAILSKVADLKPDVVYLPDYYNIVNLVTKQAKEKGITAAFMGGDGWDSADLDVKAAAGGYFTNHYSADSTAPEAVAFLKNYKAKYNATPDALAALAYDAANILLTGISNAGADDTAKVNTALEQIKIQAVSGSITYDKNHNPIKGATILEVTPDGVKFNSVVNP
jgi:branched-chain amino acid transport system substrate-binding protein